MITRAVTWTRGVQDAYIALQHQRRLYEGDHGAVFLAAGTRLPFELVITNLLGECLTEPLADLMFPAPPRIELQPDGQTDAVQALLSEMGWAEALYPTAIRASYAGCAVWKLVWDPVSARTELLQWGATPGEFATFDTDGRWVAFWYDVCIEGKGAAQAKTYKVRELHEVSGDGTRVTNTAFPMQGSQVKAQLVPWAQLAPAWGEGLQPEEETFLEGLTLLPGYCVNNVLGQSDYTRSRKNLQWRMILLDSARNFTVGITSVPQLVVPPEAIDPRTNAVNWEKLMFQVRRPGDGSQATIEMKTLATSLGDSTKVQEQLWQSWNAVCPISPIFYGAAVGSDASGKALGISLLGTRNAVNRRRRAYIDATRWAVEYGQQLRSHFAGETATPVDALTLQFPEAIPEDPADRTTRIGAAVGKWMSTEEAITEEHPEWTDEQVQQELERLKADKDFQRQMAVPAFSAPAGGAL